MAELGPAVWPGEAIWEISAQWELCRRVASLTIQIA